MTISKSELKSGATFFILFQQLWSPILIFGIVNDFLAFLSKLVAFIIILECLMSYKTDKSVIKLPIMVSLIYFFLLLSTIHGDGDIRRWFSMAYCPIGIAALFAMNFRTEVKAKLFLKSISSLFFIICALEFIFVIIYPSGIPIGNGKTVYFLGGENMVGFPLLIGLIVTICKTYLFNSKYTYVYIYLTMQCLTIFIIFSGGNVVGTLLAVCFISPLFKPLAYIRIIKLLFAYLGVFLVLIVFNNLQNVITAPFIRYIVEDCLGKDLSLTHRTVIWDQVLYYFFKNPFWGYGIRESVNLFTIMMGSRVNTLSAHNQLLQSLYEGGILLYLSFIPLFYNVNSALKNKEIRRYFNAGLIGILSMYMTEASGIVFIVILLSLAYSFGSFIGSKSYVI